jgi:hypothetical protein
MYTVDASVWVNAFDQREPGHLVSREFLDVPDTFEEGGGTSNRAHQK